VFYRSKSWWTNSKHRIFAIKRDTPFSGLRAPNNKSVSARRGKCKNGLKKNGSPIDNKKQDLLSRQEDLIFTRSSRRLINPSLVEPFLVFVRGVFRFICLCVSIPNIAINMWWQGIAECGHIEQSVLFHLSALRQLTLARCKLTVPRKSADFSERAQIHFCTRPRAFAVAHT